MKEGGYGRHFVTNLKTGKVYCVEPIIPNEKYKGEVWGDVNPATGKIEGNYGEKYRAGVTEQESIITEANGFKNIVYVDGSPYSYIESQNK